MGNSSFRFRQFEIEHHRCAQKVGTDGVLLGAWAPVEGVRRVLDVGTGCGLIALMLAQRTEAEIVGIDIDEESVCQARENAERSPWKERIRILWHDFTSPLAPAEQAPFDAIVSNPPFFSRSLECPDQRRSQARHTSALPLPTLASRSAGLLTDGGTLSVILPFDAAEDFIFRCQTAGLILARRCDVQTTATKPPRRVLLHFVKGAFHTELNSTKYTVPAYVHEYLTLLTHDGTRTPEHQALTQDFYLW